MQNVHLQNPNLVAESQTPMIPMSLFKILKYPHPILAKKAQLVSTFDESLKLICTKMLNTMYSAPGIGLAAPQVGLSLAIIVIDIDFEAEIKTLANGDQIKTVVNKNPHIFINPKIYSTDQTFVENEEGCLSLPGIFEKVSRPENIELEYQDLNGKFLKLSAQGLLSVCIQHEIDHLNGKVFIDHLGQLKKSFIKKKLSKNK
jgi:peptide deformylase